MVIVAVIVGDLLQSSEPIIAQQCNCVTVKSHGLSETIAARFPYADCYKMRRAKSRNTAAVPATPGTIQALGPLKGDAGPLVVCMFAQWAPGKPGAFRKYYTSDYEDTEKDRAWWFQLCLNEIIAGGITSIAMPYLIGCGLAGGEWAAYEKMLEQSELKVTLYKLKG